MADDKKAAVKVTFDLPADLHAWLKEKAEEEERSVSAELRRLVRRQHESSLKAA